MVSHSPVSCPQCFHENSPKTLKCELCDHPLKIDESVVTRLPNESINELDPNKTIAPGISQKTVNNLDKTTLSHTKSVHSFSEKQTFHFAGDLAHFEIHEILGQGGMGAVYHAKDKTLHRDVAIKMMRPVAASSGFNTEALLEEARMACQLNHPNIVTIYDIARSKDSNYIVMEWVDGQPLDELIPEDGLTLIKSLEYACQIADGLSNAHKKYIIHKDIKPHNIMLSSNNVLKILDFGIAGYFKNNEKDSNEHLDSAQLSSGTPSYMSPEQAQGLNLDQRSDIFSFGIVMYQMLCGKRPFEGQNFSELKDNICNGNYTPIQNRLPELPERVTSLIDKMLDKAKHKRWQTSSELADELHDIYSEYTHKKNWWQRRNWYTKIAIILPFMMIIGWSSKEILFPASTQQLIERQLKEANKIAILPFENISGDPEIQLFGDGLAVNLGSDLSAIASHQGNTWIVPSTEISRMKDQSVKAVSDKYGVNLVLTGSIQHMGSTRLMVLNLLNATTGQQLKTTEISIKAKQLFQGHHLIRSKALELLNWMVPNELKERFVAQRPQLDGAYKEFIRGQGYLYRFDQLDNIENAIQAFKTAIEIDQDYEKPYIGLAELYLLKYKNTENKSWLDTMTTTVEKLKTLNQENNQIGYLLAELSMQKGEYKNAVKLYKESVKANPKHIKSQIGLAKAYNKLNNIEMAELTYQNTIKAAPNNWDSVVEFGIFYSQIGKYNKALEQFKRLSEMSPNNNLGFRNMAGIYYYLGNIDDAIKYTKLAINIRPSDRAYSNLGTMLFSIEEYNEAISAYEKAIELKDNYYVHWGNLADAYKQLNDKNSVMSFQNAIDRAKNVLDTNPNDTTAIAAMAYYLANIQNVEQSLFYAEQIGEKNTGYDNFFVATAYDTLNMIDQSLNHLKIAIEKNYPIDEIKSTPLLAKTRESKKFSELVK